MKRVKFTLHDVYNGVKFPENTKKVDRSTRYGNPYKVGNNEGEFSRVDALKLYKIYLDDAVKNNRLDIERLRGFDLACSCNLEDDCHADILINKINNL